MILTRRCCLAPCSKTRRSATKGGRRQWKEANANAQVSPVGVGLVAERVIRPQNALVIATRVSRTLQLPACLVQQPSRLPAPRNHVKRNHVDTLQASVMTGHAGSRSVITGRVRSRGVITGHARSRSVITGHAGTGSVRKSNAGTGSVITGHAGAGSVITCHAGTGSVGTGHAGTGSVRKGQLGFCISRILFKNRFSKKPSGAASQTSVLPRGSRFDLPRAPRDLLLRFQCQAHDGLTPRRKPPRWKGERRA